MRGFLITVFVLNCAAFAWADSLDVVFKPLFNGSAIVLGQPMEGIDMQVEWHTVRLYVGEFAAATDTVKNYYLMGQDDMQSQMKVRIPLHVRSGDRVRFGVGVDSLTQVSGAMRGDLDPQFGMYWAWQSGYISAKLEGTLIWPNGKKQNFEYHLGGYRDGVCAHDWVAEVDENKQLTLAIDFSPWLQAISATGVFKLMSPGQQNRRWFHSLFPIEP